MALEEVKTGLQNAISRGESLERAMQTLIIAGYNTQEVQEAARQINMGVIGNIGVVQEIPMQKTQPAPIAAERKEEKPQETSELITKQYQKLPAPAESMAVSAVIPETKAKEKKKMPKWLIISIIAAGLILIVIVLLGILGPKILDSMTK